MKVNRKMSMSVTAGTHTHPKQIILSQAKKRVFRDLNDPMVTYVHSIVFYLKTVQFSNAKLLYAL